MIEAAAVLEKAEQVLSRPDGVDEIPLPAVRDVIRQVAEFENVHMGYKKHSNHTKTSTKGCVMGCIGG